MSQDGIVVGASQKLPELRTCGLLRRLAQQACDGSLPLDKSPGNQKSRAGRRLGLVLRGRGRNGTRASAE